MTYEDDDYFYDVTRSNTMTVVEEDDSPIPTGIYNANGMQYMRQRRKEPIGFRVPVKAKAEQKD